MKKPSIFSKNYEKTMRRRRKIKVISGVFLVFIVISSIFIYFNYDYIHTNILNGKVKKKEDDKNLSNEKSEKNIENQKSVNKKEKEEKIIFKLNDDLKVEGVINKENKSEFKEMIPNSDISYEFNKEKNMVLIFNKKTDQMFLAYINGEVEDISCEFFTSKNGNKIERKTKLKNEPDFIWTESPKLYNNKVFYLSKLPNSNNYNRYFVWIYDMKNKSHTCIYDKNLRSKQMNIGEITEKGLEIKMDSSVKYVNEEGKINK